MRQAALQSNVPVAQRAALRIVQELGMMDSKGKMMRKKMVEALIKRFKEPLTKSDIQGIAKLTDLDVGALRIAAGLAGPDAVAEEAQH